MAPPVSTSRILQSLREIAAILDELREDWALIGGLAVSLRTEPRFTRDVDLAVAVSDDSGAEGLIHRLAAWRYRPFRVLEHKTAGRLSTVRVLPPGEDEDGVIVDFLFAASGIEGEIVAKAERVAILPDLTVPLARRGHLVAMKLLALGPHRRHDAADLHYLLRDIPPEELALARSAICLMEQSGYHRGKALGPLLDSLLPGC